MSSPLVSIVITSYNYAHFIRTAIDSALGQDYPNLEVIVTDNQSTDDTLEVLAPYRSEPRFRLNVNPTNIDITPNINRGLELAQGEFAVILSADDFLLPTHTSRLVAMAQRHPDIGVIYANALFADPNGIPYSVRNVFGQALADYVGGRNEFPYLLAACYVCLPSLLFSRRLLEQHGLLDPALGVASDWEICLRYAAAGEQFGYTTTPLAAIRMHANQQSAFRYQASGRELTDSLAILERYIVPEHFYRYSGYEAMILRTLRDRRDRLQENGPESLTPEVVKRVERLEGRLIEDWDSRATAPAQAEPKVAVVLTTTGRVALLGRAVESLVKQTHACWEATVVQDGGFDMSSFVDMYHDARLRVARTAQTLGPPGARSVGLTLADGDYVVFLDEDDEFAPNHLASLVATLQQEATDVAVAGTKIVFDEYAPGSLIRRPLGQTTQLRPLRPVLEDLETAPMIPLGAVMFSKGLAQRLMRFDERFGMFAEWEMLLRAWKATRFAATGEHTFVEHAGLDLKMQMLRSRLSAYVASLDALYGAYPPTTLESLQRRERYRARIAAALQRPPRFAELDGLVELYSVLSAVEQSAPVGA